MAFKDYENLDVTPEIATKKELRKLKKKYGVDCKYGIGTQEIVLSLIIALILTVAIIMLYGNVIKLSIDFITGIFVPYFGMLSIVVFSICCIIKKINTKWNVCVALLVLDELICMTSLLIANMIPIGGILQIILPITGTVTFVLFVPLMYMVNKFGSQK